MSLPVGMLELWSAWIVTASLRAAVLATAAVLVDRLAPRRTCPAVRAGLWLTVPGAFLLPPWWTPVPAVEAVPLATLGAVAAPGPDSFALLFVAWVVGALGLTAVTLRGSFAARAALRDGGEVAPAAAVVSAARRATQRLGLSRSPSIRVVEGSAGPCVLGCLRPTVLLPADLVHTSSVERLEHVLLHEFAHVVRRDPLRAVVSSVALALLWFHPAAWLATRRLHALRELAADERVVRALRGDTVAYRRTLVSLSRHLVTPRAAVTGFLGRGELTSRLELLERRSLAHPAIGRTLAAAIAAAAMFCCTPIGGAAADGVAFTVPPLEDLRGCMQLRFAVLHELASEDAARAAR